MQEESPEGGRFKKEIVVDGHSYLLLIRDEGGPPELQVLKKTLCFVSPKKSGLPHTVLWPTFIDIKRVVYSLFNLF
jgi:hypothetical protein